MFGHPIFLSVETGKNSVYSCFMNDQPDDVSRFYSKEILNYINVNPYIIGISFYGGNFGTKECMRLINRCREKSIQVSFDISCSENDKAFIKDNIALINVVRLFIYSLDNKKNDVMFFDNSLDSITHFIAYLKKKPLEKVMVMPILQNNYFEMPDILKICIENGFKFNPLPIPIYCNKHISHLSKDSISDFMKLLQSMWCDELYLDFPLCYMLGKPSICPALRMSVDIGMNGKIKPCKFSKFNLGDITNLHAEWRDFYRYWNKSESCNQCPDLLSCGGGCFANKRNCYEQDYYCVR